MTYNPRETFPKWFGSKENILGLVWIDDIFYACERGSPAAIANGFLPDEEPEVKATMPKARFRVKKVPMSGMPINVLLEVRLGRTSRRPEIPMHSTERLAGVRYFRLSRPLHAVAKWLLWKAGPAAFIPTQTYLHMG